jgi:hypothetical protein
MREVHPYTEVAVRIRAATPESEGKDPEKVVLFLLNINQCRTVHPGLKKASPDGSQAEREKGLRRGRGLQRGRGRGAGPGQSVMRNAGVSNNF